MLADDRVGEWQQKLAAFILDWLTDQPDMLLQTSGSTGKPKQIEVQKNDMLLSAGNTIDFFRLHENHSVLLALPLDYVAAKLMVVRAFAGKLNLISVKPEANPLKNLHRPVDFAAFTPYQMQAMLDSQTDIRKARNIIVGGAAINAALRKKIAIHHRACFETYGMTETLTHVALRPVNETDELFFTALRQFEFSTDNDSCLRIKTPYRVGEIRTNDVVELLDKKRFVLKGRKDYVINSGGIKIFPEEIEAVFSHTIPQRFFAYGISSVLLGQELVLFVETSCFSEPEIEQLKRFARQNLQKTKRPRKYIAIPVFLETSTGKIHKQQTVQKYLSGKNHD